LGGSFEDHVRFGGGGIRGKVNYSSCATQAKSHDSASFLNSKMGYYDDKLDIFWALVYYYPKG